MLTQLRLIIKDELIREIKKKISASPEYMKKEDVRQQLQDEIAMLIKSKAIKTQKQLDTWFVKKTSTTSNADELMALNALKMIPFSIFQNLK
jgi:hypothetical protein